MGDRGRERGDCSYKPRNTKAQWISPEARKGQRSFPCRLRGETALLTPS